MRLAWSEALALLGLALLGSASVPEAPRDLPGVAEPLDPSLRVVASALPWLGSPYRLGGEARSGVDCSGFVASVLKAAEVPPPVPRQSAAFATFGQRVAGSIEPGDILLFGADTRIDHVGIALSPTTFIHAASRGPRTGVIISSLKDPTWDEDLVMARRVEEEDR